MKRKFYSVAGRTSLLFFLLILFLVPSPILHASASKENYNDYNEVDPNNHINFTSYHVDHNACMNEDAYLYKDEGIGYFTNFEMWLDANMCSAIAGTGSYVWIVATELDDGWGLRNSPTAEAIVLNFYNPSSEPSYNRIYFDEYTDGNRYASTVDLLKGTMYYFRLLKEGTSAKCKIYGNPTSRQNDENVIITLSLTLHGEWSFQYVYACSSSNSGASDKWVDNDIENLEIIVRRTITFCFNEGGIFRIDNVTMSNNTEIEYFNGTVIELASLPQNSSYVFLNFLSIENSSNILKVNTWVNVHEGWIPFGTQPPYLHDDDILNYIRLRLVTENLGKYNEYYTFQSVEGEAEIVSVILYVKAKLQYVVSKTQIKLYLWDSASWVECGLVEYDSLFYETKSLDVTSILDTINKVNNTRLKIELYSTENPDGNSYILITYAYLNVITQIKSTSNPFNFTVTNNATLWCVFDKPSSFPQGLLFGGIIAFILVMVIALAYSKR